MGRRILLTDRGRVRAAPLLSGALWLLAACAAPPPGTVARTENDPHRELACIDCHDGVQADRATALVPAATCGASECHADGGPRVVQLASVVFEHRGHGGDSLGTAMGCAGCHSHVRPEAPLSAGVDACSLCHLGQQAAGAAGECRLCHEDLGHAGVTSQGLDVPHEELPWVDGGCVRCHYDVTEPPVEVPVLRCGSCHADLDAAVAGGVGQDLHASHTEASCVSCHAEGGHHIRAMSSAVSLQCADCHQEVHAVTVEAGFPAPATCNACHTGAHADQQRLVLGLVDGLAAPLPSQKFMAGLTCRSCHASPPPAEASDPVPGTAQSCVACHRAEYATVARWWEEGAAERLRRADAYVAAATRGLGDSASDEARSELASARSLIETVRRGGAVHNLPLAHRLLEAASEAAARAYTLEGRGVPRTPDLGREPRMGLCSYCHYRADDPWVFQEMSGSFHREVLRIGER